MSSSETGQRCLILTQMREHGFSGNQVHALAVRTFLASHGWEVAILTPFSGRSLLRNAVFGLRFVLKHINGELDIFWYRYGHGLYLERAIAAELRRDERPVVLYAQDPQSAEAALKLRRPDKDKVVMIVHFNDSQADEWVLRGTIPKDGWLYRKIARLEVEVLPRVDAIVYVSAYMEGRLEERIPALRTTPHEIIPNFVEVPIANPEVEPRDLIAVGTLEPRKNQAYVLQVIAALAARGLRVTATLVGGGPDRGALERLARELGIEGQVLFTGNVSGAARWIPAHRLQVHAAHMENCPISLIEAMAAGVPVVAAAVGGIPEIIDATTGDFWDLGSVEDGADRVQALLEDPARLAAMKVRAREKYAAVFAPEVAAARLMRVFHRLLQGPN